MVLQVCSPGVDICAVTAAYNPEICHSDEGVKQQVSMTFTQSKNYPKHEMRARTCRTVYAGLPITKLTAGPDITLVCPERNSPARLRERKSEDQQTCRPCLARACCHTWPSMRPVVGSIVTRDNAIRSQAHCVATLNAVCTVRVRCLSQRAHKTIGNILMLYNTSQSTKQG